MIDEDYKALKVRLTQMVPSDRKHEEIEQHMLQTEKKEERMGVDSQPSAIEILEAFPRLQDTKGLVCSSRILLLITCHITHH